MKIFETAEDHYSYLGTLVAEKPQFALISSYGIYAGITHEGANLNLIKGRETLSDKFLNSLQGVQKVCILVGVNKFLNCNGFVPCQHCQRTYYRYLLRLLSHKEHYTQFLWRASQCSHAKCSLFVYKKDGVTYYKGVIGGRNLNDSNWLDYSFSIEGEDAASLLKKVLLQYNLADKLSPAYLNGLAREHNIDSNVIESFLI